MASCSCTNSPYVTDEETRSAEVTRLAQGHTYVSAMRVRSSLMVQTYVVQYGSREPLQTLPLNF